MSARQGGDTVFCGDEINREQYEGPLWPFLKESMLSHGSRIALVNPYTEEEFSYSRVVSLAERLSRGLRKLGLREGKSLCIVAPNSVENALLVLATLATGGVVHSLNPASMPGEIRRQLDQTEAKVLVTVPELLPSVQQACQGTDIQIITIGPRDGNLNYDDLLTLGSEDVALPTTFGDPHVALSFLLFSSGTTGLPKGVEATQRGIKAFLCSFVHMMRGTMSKEDTVMLFLPLFHAFGQVIILLSSLVMGSKAVIMAKFDLHLFLTFIDKYKMTVLYLVPPVVIGMLSLPDLSRYDLSHVRTVIVGGAPTGKETSDQFEAKMGIPILQGFGMTEIMVVTMNTSTRNRPSSTGCPLPGVELKIVDAESGQSVGANTVGDLYVRSPQIMAGYLNNPQATRDTIDPDGWLNTGDIGKVDSDGFLYIVDRKKELIKYKGEQVAPAVLEDVLLGHPAVADACVIGKPDTVAGELPLAFVVLRSGHTLTSQQVKDFVADNVPSYMQLRGGVVFTQEIPKSPSGKILRRILRDQLKEQLKSKL